MTDIIVYVKIFIVEESIKKEEEKKPRKQEKSKKNTTNKQIRGRLFNLLLYHKTIDIPS